MNRRTLATALLATALAFTACAKKEASLTEEQKAVIRQEVLQTMKTIWDAAEKMEPTTTRFIQDNPDFLFVMPDGKAYTYAEFNKVWTEMVSLVRAQKIVIRREKVIPLTPDTALYCWEGGNDLIQKDGVVLRADPYCGTYLFRKAGTEWKAAYLHESSLPMAPMKSPEAGPAKK